VTEQAKMLAGQLYDPMDHALLAAGAGSVVTRDTPDITHE
jgi:hypothetical protein